MKLVARIGMAVGAAAAVSVVATFAVVFACTQLATLNMSAPAGLPGAQVSVTGSSFGVNAADNGAAGSLSPISLHWNATDGPVLATVVPDGSGAMASTAITIPTSAQPGFYAIVATQKDTDGNNAYGTPARAGFQVLAPGGAPAGSDNQALPASTTPVQTSTAASGGIGAGGIALLAIIGLAGVTLFGVGAATVLGGARKVPSASRVDKQ